MFDFPSNPTVGQEYTSGGVTYIWNGYGWSVGTAGSGGGGTGNYVLKTGDTMTGPLVLPADPTANLQAATKQYVDTKAPYVKLAGDTMTGDLNISKTFPTLAINTTSGTATLTGKRNSNQRWSLYLGDNSTESGGNTGSNFHLVCHNDSGGVLTDALYAVRSTGLVQVSGDPTAALGIATKQYTDNFVKWSAAQALTANQQLQARQNVYAAPIDALAYNGMQINGDGVVSQELGNNGLTVASGTFPYIADGWMFGWKNASSAGPHWGGQVNTSAYWTFLGGYRSGVRASFSNNWGALAAGEYAMLYTKIEGYRCARLMLGHSSAQSFSFAYMFYGPSTGGGTIFTRIGNNANNRFYYVEHTVTAGGPTYCTGTVPGDTTGTWENTNLAGLTFAIVFAGNDTPVAPNAWTSTASNKTTNSTSLALGNYQVLVTGFIVVPGNEVPPQTRLPFIMRPYDDELLLCLRQWEKLTFVVSQGAPPTFFQQAPWKIIKRAAPTLTTSFDAGTGAVIANYVTDPTYGVYQSGAHSSGAHATVKGDARL